MATINSENMNKGINWNEPVCDVEDMKDITAEMPHDVNEEFYGSKLQGVKVYEDWNGERWAMMDGELERLTFHVTAEGDEWSNERVCGTFSECMDYIKHEEEFTSDDNKGASLCLVCENVEEILYCSDVL